MVESKDPRILQLENGMVTEASTLGFDVGRYPKVFRTTDDHEFEYFKDEFEHGELVAVKYVDKVTKGVLTVFND